MAAPKAATTLAGDDVGANVIDCGSWLVRVGAAGDDAPRALVSPFVGIPRARTQQTAPQPAQTANPASPAPAATSLPPKNPPRPRSPAQPVARLDYVAGDKLLLAPLSFSDVRPVHSYDTVTGAATVVDWDAMQSVWEAGANSAGVQLSAAPLLLIEPTRRWTASDDARAAALERAFEGVCVPAAYIARGAPMAAFASVRTTACVVDVGHQGAAAVPVIDGYALQKTTVCSSVGGRYLSDRVYEFAHGVIPQANVGKDGAAELDGAQMEDVRYAGAEESNAMHAIDSRTPTAPPGGSGGGAPSGCPALGSRFGRLRAVHEVKRRRRDAGRADGTGEDPVREYDVQDLSMQGALASVSDAHRAFYRMRVLDDMKASVFRVSPGLNSKEIGKKKGGDREDAGGSGGTDGCVDAIDGHEASASNGANGNGNGVGNGNEKDKEGGKDVDREKEREREIEKSKERERLPSNSSTYQLPDGNFVDVSKHAEGLFADAMFYNGSGDEKLRRAISNMAYDAISACDMDVRRELYSGIVLTGGSSLTPGTTERFTREMALLTPQMFKMKILAAQNSIQRTAGPWIGGSIVASLGTFQQAWVSKAEYDELGSRGALRKCP